MVRTSVSLSLTQDFCSVMQCTNLTSGTNIFGPTVYSTYKATTLGDIGTIGSGWNAAKLNNGYIIQFRNFPNCSPSNVWNTSTAKINACAFLYVDTNGSQGPNMQGYDFLGFWIIQQNNGTYSLLPAGAPGDGWGGCYVGTWWSCTYQRIFDPNNMP